MKLSNLFLNELFKSILVNRQTTAICSKFLKLEYIPKELPEYKHIFRAIIPEFENTGEILTVGMLSQKFTGNTSIQDVLKKINNTKIPEFDGLIKQLESYIKNVRFQQLNEKVVDMYKKGEQEEAIQLMATESDEINRLSLRFDGGAFVNLFETFEERQSQRAIENETDKGLKVPFAIDVLDEITYNGLDATDIALWIMRSGVGKSTVLKWTGIQSALHGYDVLHVQLEGSSKEAEDKYDQIWTSQPYLDIANGEISEETMQILRERLKQYKHNKKELHLYSFERFGDASMVDIRELIMEYERARGTFPDLILIDSLDLLDTGLHKKLDKDPAFKKAKLQKVAQLMKNIAVEFKTRILTATQTSDVPKEKWDNYEFIIDRSFTEGDRTLVKPFSFVFTGNRTLEEEKTNTLRIYIDKLRNYNPQERIYPIKTNFDKGKFYDKKSTLNLLHKPDEKDV